MMDTLSYADYLDRNGFSHEQAAALAHAAHQYMPPQIVTHDYLDATIARLVLKLGGLMVGVGAVYSSVLLYVLKH